MWGAVDGERDVVERVVQKRRDTRASLKLLNCLHFKWPVDPEGIVSDGLSSYGSALPVVDREDVHRRGRLSEHGRSENSHPPILRANERCRGSSLEYLPNDS